MPTQVQSILRQATRKKGDKLNILTFPSDEHYDTSLCETGHNFFGLKIPDAKEWDTLYPMPKNYHAIPTVGNQATLPIHVEFDMLIAHDRILQFQVASQLSQEYQIPVVLVEHSLPPEEWGENRIAPLRNRSGIVNVFVAETQRAAWGFDASYSHVLNPIGINTTIFSPSQEIERDDHVLWLGNDIAHKDEVYGFSLMRYVTGFPMPMMKVKIIGRNPGVSRAPEDIQHLVSCYRQAGVFLNTRPNDPLPTNMLEAMACGCPVVSLAVGDIPKIIKHGETGFISKNPEELKTYCGMIMADRELATKLSNNGRELIRKRFGVARFVKSWQDILTKALEE